MSSVNRREALKRGAVGVAGLAAAARVLSGSEPRAPGRAHHPDASGAVGEVTRAGIDPLGFLEAFDYGTVERLPSGKVRRTYELHAVDKEIEVAPGVFFAAWTYNGQVPGPTLRATEGDLVRVNFRNLGTHPHTIHFHGIHPANMDGVFEVIGPGQSYVYEFEARPFGLQLYHCHSVPLKKHIHKGLYGAFIIDPRTPRPPAREMVMVMNGFDTNFDGENEVYAVNTVAFHYQRHPIVIERGELIRVYLANFTEFDLINSIHLHGNFFRYWKTGTRPEQYDWTDTVMLCQGERGFMEFTFDFPGRFMFHAHQSEFAELGWMGLIEVRGPAVA